MAMATGAIKPAPPAAVAGATTGGGPAEELASAATIPPETAHEEPRIPAGTMIADRYRIERVLGEGGMGVVYAAEHVLMRKEVAVKVLHAEMCSMPEVVARFEREAIAAAHIDHPNVAAATDFGRLPDGSCYLALELLRGTSLRDEITKGPIPLGRSLHILRGIASGVAAAHAKGVVHRDIKPENVMLVDRNGDPDFVKVLDFGIAKVDPSVAAAPGVGGKVLTRVGTVFGTPEYMAPEQAVGDTVDARADLYALGVVFLEMLTGKCPFTGTPLSILRERLLAVGPPDMSGVGDPGAQALIARLLTRQPDDRMQTAAELLLAIDALAEERRGGSLPPAVMPSPGGSSASASATTNPVLVTAATAVSTTRPRWFLPAGIAAILAVAFGMYGLVSAMTRPKTAVVTASSGRPIAETEPPPKAPESPSEASPSESMELPDTPPAASASSPGRPKAPAPTASAASARTPRTKQPPRRRTQPPPKKTGPGGIYVPPPKDWFK